MKQRLIKPKEKLPICYGKYLYAAFLAFTLIMANAKDIVDLILGIAGTPYGWILISPLMGCVSNGNPAFLPGTRSTCSVTTISGSSSLLWIKR